jgi:HAD superfamily hydrolase (TIGR01509 family)
MPAFPGPQPTPMPLRAIFFDLDDTLCDTIGARPQRARNAFGPLCRDNLHLDIEALIARCLEPLEEPRSIRGPRVVLAELGLEGTPAGEEVMRRFLGEHEHLVLFPGARGVIVALSRRYTLGIITNAAEWYQAAKLRHVGLEPYFRHVLISGAFGCAKPDPRIFRHALTLAGVAPHEAVFVGDRLDLDVAGAKAVGMHAIWFNHWGGEVREGDARPDATIRHLSELPGAIEALGA